jgi:hypothetical protein
MRAAAAAAAAAAEAYDLVIWRSGQTPAQTTFLA